MGNVTVLNHLTLDGVMQAPGRPDEDRRGDFPRGGWAQPRGDSVVAAFGGIRAGSALLFGRRTYEDLFGFWPNQTNNPFTAALDNARKYVASTTLQEPLAWRNATLLQGDAAEAVAALKQRIDSDLLIMGSGALIQSLMPHDLIDRYILLIHPLILGTGRRLFESGAPPTSLTLGALTTTDSGVLVATYEPVRRA